MKPLYKYNKKTKTKKKNQKKVITLPPSSILQSKVDVRRTPSPPQGAYYCTFLKDPCRHNPKMRALWVGQPAEVRQRQKTALIALISKDNKTISVLLPKRFRTWGFSFHFSLFSVLFLITLAVKDDIHTQKFFYCFNNQTHRIYSSKQPYPAIL